MTDSSLHGYGYLACRHYGHAWDDTSAKWAQYINVVGRKWSRKHRELILETPCFRCTTVRLDRYNPRSFEWMGRAYDYVDGYLQHDDGRRLKKRDFTVAYLAAGAKKAITVNWEDEQ